MSVLLLILKIIGIVLLTALGILLLIAILVLSVPVRYRISGETKEDVRIQAHFTWLLHLLAFHVSYEDGAFATSFRIFGIRKKMKEKRDEEQAGAYEDDIDIYEDEVEAEENSRAAEMMKMPEKVSAKMPTEKSPWENAQKQNAEPEKKGILYRIRSFFTDIREGFLKFKQECKKKVFDIKNTIANIKEILTEETNQIAVRFLWTEMLSLLKHFRFRKICTDLVFSLGDPALTGQTLGVLGMLPFLYQYEIRIYPDFESDEPYLKGTFEAKGHIRGLHFLVFAIRMFGKKECRAVISKIMKYK